MPFSSACHTPLSNFEAGQNYKEVVDPAIIVSFPLETDPEVLLVAWTTTPWTLPSNLAVCVHPTFCYVKVKDLKKGKVYILMEDRLGILFKKEEDYEVIEKYVCHIPIRVTRVLCGCNYLLLLLLFRFPGQNLFGLRYIPLFNYFSKHRSDDPTKGSIAVNSNHGSNYKENDCHSSDYKENDSHSSEYKENDCHNSYY